MTVLSQTKNKAGIKAWKCKCACGNTTTVITSKLRNGHTKSCGCYQVQRAKEHNTKHGHNSRKNGHSSEYGSWSAMKTRCDNPKSDFYCCYGAIGITYDKTWKTFKNFLRDMGPKPSSKHSIDRINVTKNYDKANCKWATALEQANNKKTSRYITYNNTTLTMAQWAKKINITRRTLANRIDKLKWTEAKALTTKLKS